MGNYLEGLVDDIIIQILSVLSVWDLLCLRQTSKRMEMLTHIRSVWHDVFRREVLDSGRPVPGCSFTITPRLLALCGANSEEAFLARFADEPFEEALIELIESWDLEARTLHALRLEKRWKSVLGESTSADMKPGQQQVAVRSCFRTPLPVREILLLPGGRFAVTIHRDRLLCWDLSFPRAIEETNENIGGVTKKSPVARCAGEWVAPKGMVDYISVMDTSGQLIWKKDSGVCIVVCANAKLTWSGDVSLTDRLCVVLSLKDAYLRPRDLQSLSPRGSPFSSPIPAFVQERLFTLPQTLSTPVYIVSPGEPAPPDEFGPHRFNDGRLGALLQVHESLLFFESFTPGSEGSGSPKYAGIEVLDRNDTGKEGANSILLEYPDSQLGAFMGLHVYESAEGVVVAWQNCLGIYPLPRFTEDWFSPELESLSIINRRVVMPTIIFAMSESIAQPVAFSTCSVVPGADARDPLEPPLPLTILARSRHHPHITVQTVLTAMSVSAFLSICTTRVLSEYPSSANPSPSSSTSPHANAESNADVKPKPCAAGTRQFRFRLTRIPASTPHFFAPLTSGSGSGREEEGITALALGTSGRGVRVDTCGAVYRCASADVVLPHFAGFGFGDMGLGDVGLGGGLMSSSSATDVAQTKRRRPSNLVSTVDFWPYRRVDSVPEELLRRPNSSAREREGREGAEGGEPVESRLVVRFDEGMGRIIAARVRVSVDDTRADEVGMSVGDAKLDESERDQDCTVAVIDFA